ncbi:MAG: putative 2OG-Fe(II) oxygenase [Undibacterium sp.]|uniref:putative 2OG-Fe(II) oxygenase n=1 Tax=Undibacterium sp. TaxID=1914977 RepID=UPI002722AA1F|nr:putative 2OG-Fe(II) oxygenase [Undibacterium sp.]MDO8653363.1 putative 2OG-Fe(II) oxygenase [Undibacterium sp.]
MHLKLPDTATFSTPEKIEFLKAALHASPDAPWLRMQLGGLLLLRDDFEGVISLLHGRQFEGVWQHRARMLEGNAWMSKATPEANLQASKMFELAFDAAAIPITRARALAALGKACIRLNKKTEARTALESSLLLDPRNPDAQKRLTAMDLNEGRESDALRRCDAMLKQGVNNSRLLADRYLLLALLGREKEAQEQEGLDQFLSETTPLPPFGWSSIEEFNNALSEELYTHPSLRYERYGTASTASWRIDEPLLARSKVFPALLEMIRREALSQLERLDDGHVLQQSKPERALIRAWSVLAQGSGHEEWHMHQSGWISGVYYVAVPDSVKASSDKRGCIEFGNPELPHIPRVTSEQRITIRPSPGKLLMFPSQAYHHTYPSDSSERRLVVAFDIVPIDS